MEDKMDNNEQSVKLEGIDIEYQLLPTVAASLAVLSMTGENNEVRVIIEKSRRYLNLLLDNAIEKNTKKV